MLESHAHACAEKNARVQGLEGAPLGHVKNYSYNFEEPFLYLCIFLLFAFRWISLRACLCVVRGAWCLCECMRACMHLNYCVCVRACVRCHSVSSPSESEIGRKNKYVRYAQRWRAIVGR